MNFSPTSFIDILEYWTEKTPNKVAYIFLADGEDTEEKITFKELRERVILFASNLNRQIGKNNRILILNPAGLDFIISFLGCLYAEIIPVPLYPPDKHSLNRMISVSSDCSATIALANSQIIEKFDSYKLAYSDSLQVRSKEYNEFLKVTADLTLLDTRVLQINDNVDLKLVRPERDQIAFLQYTSGSTSKPKGVMVSHYNLVHNSMLIHKYFGHDTNHCKVSWLPPFHDMGLIGEVLQSLYSGMTLVFMAPNSFLKKPFRWLRAISKYSHLGLITSGSPNFGYDFCVETVSDEQISQINLKNWKIAYNGAEPVRIATLENFAKKFKECGFKRSSLYPVYGLAENTLVVSVPKHLETPIIGTFDATLIKEKQIVKESDSVQNSVSLPSCGVIYNDQKVTIVDPESMQKYPDGHIGEIWIKGESVAKGYWNNSDETKRTFEAYLPDSGEGPFMRTGDLGFILNNNLYITGRLKDLIIICGHNHYPQDIEITVESVHEAIRPSGGAAFAIDDNFGNEKLVVVYELKRKFYKTLNFTELKGKIRDAVFKKHGINVSDIVFIEQSSFPKTSSGKHQRQLCKKQYIDSSLEIIKNETNITI